MDAYKNQTIFVLKVLTI